MFSPISTVHVLPRTQGLVQSMGIFFFSPLIFHLKRWTLLRPTLPAVIQPRGGNVSMSQPLLHLRDVRIVCESIRRCCGTEGMHAEAVHIRIDADHGTIALHNPLIHGI